MKRTNLGTKRRKRRKRKKRRTRKRRGGQQCPWWLLQKLKKRVKFLEQQLAQWPRTPTRRPKSAQFGRKFTPDGHYKRFPSTTPLAARRVLKL